MACFGRAEQEPQYWVGVHRVVSRLLGFALDVFLKLLSPRAILGG